jgi:two-component sensor histidine kinase
MRRLWTPGNIVIALSVGLIFVIFAIFALLCVQAYSSTVDGAKAKAQSAADAVANETAWMLGGAHAVLTQIAGVSQLPADMTPEQKAALDTALKGLPAPAALGLFDATGAVWADTSSAGLPDNVADEDFFKTLQNGGTWTISAQRADPATGAPVFVVAQRLGTDEFGGVATLTISADVFKDFWTPQNLGSNSTVSLARQDGWLIGRYPALPQAINLSTSPPFAAQAGAAAGTYVSQSSPADGVARVVAFHRMPELGLVAIASVSQQTAFDQLWTSIIIVLWLIGPVAVALLAASIITARILNRSARTQASLAAAVAHNDVLFREIHHRVKNNLQSVASLLQMQPIPREIKADMGQRIAAMSAVHEHIYRSSNFSTVQVQDYLQTLIENIRAGADPKIKVVEQLEDLSVDKDAATPLGLILNEVVANAFKHAFPGGREGVISVELMRRGDGQGQLTVADDGVGYDPETPAKGIGQRLIRALTEQIGGTAEVATGRGGSRFTLVFPLSR